MRVPCKTTIHIYTCADKSANESETSASAALNSAYQTIDELISADITDLLIERVVYVMGPLFETKLRDQSVPLQCQLLDLHDKTSLINHLQHRSRGSKSSGLSKRLAWLLFSRSEVSYLGHICLQEKQMHHLTMHFFLSRTAIMWLEGTCICLRYSDTSINSLLTTLRSFMTPSEQIRTAGSSSLYSTSRSRQLMHHALRCFA